VQTSGWSFQQEVLEMAGCRKIVWGSFSSQLTFNEDSGHFFTLGRFLDGMKPSIYDLLFRLCSRCLWRWSHREQSCTQTSCTHCKSRAAVRFFKYIHLMNPTENISDSMKEWLVTPLCELCIPRHVKGPIQFRLWAFLTGPPVLLSFLSSLI